MILSGPGGGGPVNSSLDLGGHMNSARAWPPFSAPPPPPRQHFSNEHSLNWENILLMMVYGIDMIMKLN